MRTFKSIDEYMLALPEKERHILNELRQTIRKAAPNATGAISYGIPTFKLNGKNLVHFAVFHSHYSFFPTSSGVEAFKKELKEYKTSKGTIQFPLDKPLPLGLIEKIVKFRVKENNNKR